MYTLVVVVEGILYVNVLASQPGLMSKVKLYSLLFPTRLVWGFWSNLSISESEFSLFPLVGLKLWWLSLFIVPKIPISGLRKVLTFSNLLWTRTAVRKNLCIFWHIQTFYCLGHQEHTVQINGNPNVDLS